MSFKGFYGLVVRFDKFLGVNFIERVWESCDESVGEGGDGSEEMYVDGFVERF